MLLFFLYHVSNTTERGTLILTLTLSLLKACRHLLCSKCLKTILLLFSSHRETALLIDPKNSCSSSRQWVALVVGHELAHQWFGNLVTMVIMEGDIMNVYIFTRPVIPHVSSKFCPYFFKPFTFFLFSFLSKVQLLC